MTQMDPYQRGRRDGIRWAIAWLHEEAKKMNDQNARGVLNSAAFHMGNDNSPKAADAAHEQRGSYTGCGSQQK